MTAKALVPVADGIEEMEAVIVIDILRRADVKVTVASADALRIVASRKTGLVADKTVAECASETFDLIALPGGLPGAEHLRDCPALADLLKAQASAGRWIAALCASPIVVLKHHGLLPARATCHSSCQAHLHHPPPTDAVVVDGACVTSCGPATALEFALKLVECLCGPEKARAVSAALR